MSRDFLSRSIQYRQVDTTFFSLAHCDNVHSFFFIWIERKVKEWRIKLDSSLKIFYKLAGRITMMGMILDYFRSWVRKHLRRRQMRLNRLSNICISHGNMVDMRTLHCSRLQERIRPIFYSNSWTCFSPWLKRMTFLFWSYVAMRADRKWWTIIVLTRCLKVNLIRNLFVMLFFYKSKNVLFFIISLFRSVVSSQNLNTQASPRCLSHVVQVQPAPLNFQDIATVNFYSNFRLQRISTFTGRW